MDGSGAAAGIDANAQAAAENAAAAAARGALAMQALQHQAAAALAAQPLAMMALAPAPDPAQNPQNFLHDFLSQYQKAMPGMQLVGRTSCWHDHRAIAGLAIPARAPDRHGPDEFSKTDREDLQQRFREAPKPVSRAITFVCASQQPHRRTTSCRTRPVSLGLSSTRRRDPERRPCLRNNWPPENW